MKKETRYIAMCTETNIECSYMNEARGCTMPELPCTKRKTLPLNNYKVITLCGSTRFKETFYKVARKLTVEGNIVLMPQCYGHADNIEFCGVLKTVLTNMHNQMIEMSDAIIVIDVDGYIGDSTHSEIQYADELGKDIMYFSEIKGELYE